ncbi:SsgA family sporulation/cell division regulator [Pseudonocardia acaciae]|uniref:SsgA family sporulation/cell division regulator n=1 Tax=Pseudonocardia acaciae TaxID=551276 RepID=UPI0006843A0C|nr:SsgA family sporulation/cell division regulator [Pseudonocardia acaciae]
MSPRIVIETELPITLVTSDGDSEYDLVWLSWSGADPWAVTLEIPTETGSVTWLFDRELLWSGLNAPAGRGDVLIAPATEVTAVTEADGLGLADEVVVRICSPAGCAHLFFDRGELWEFLQVTKPHFSAARDQARAGLDGEIADLIDQYGGVL